MEERQHTDGHLLLIHELHGGVVHLGHVGHQVPESKLFSSQRKGGRCYLWVSLTPLGTPVVPELKGKTATSSGETETLKYSLQSDNMKTRRVSPRHQVSTTLVRLELEEGVSGVLDGDDLDVGAGGGLLHLPRQLLAGDDQLGLAVAQLAPDLPGGVDRVEGGQHQPGLGGRHEEDRILRDVGEEGGHHLARLRPGPEEAAACPA